MVHTPRYIKVEVHGCIGMAAVSGSHLLPGPHIVMWMDGGSQLSPTSTSTEALVESTGKTRRDPGPGGFADGNSVLDPQISTCL